MANWMSPAVKWAEDDGFLPAAGESVVYRRGASSVTLDAIRSSETFDITDDSGAVTQVTVIRWTIRREDLVLSGSEVEPARDDLITDTDGRDYQVLPLGAEQVFERVSATALAVLTKQVA